MVESMKNWTWAETGFVNWTCYWPMLFTLNTCRTMCVCVFHVHTHIHEHACMYMSHACTCPYACIYLLWLTVLACDHFLRRILYLIWYDSRTSISAPPCVPVCACMLTLLRTSAQLFDRSIHGNRSCMCETKNNRLWHDCGEWKWSSYKRTCMWTHTRLS